MNAYSKAVECDDQQTICVVSYTSLLPSEWERITQITLSLSNAEIGPLVLKIDDIVHRITYQYVTPLNNPNNHPTLTKAQLGVISRSMVKKMHDSLDIAHSDLSPDNIGYIGEKIYFIDHDELFNISSGVTPWTAHLMETNQCTFEQLVNSDYRRVASW